MIIGGEWVDSTVYTQYWLLRRPRRTPVRKRIRMYTTYPCVHDLACISICMVHTPYGYGYGQFNQVSTTCVYCTRYSSFFIYKE